MTGNQNRANRNQANRNRATPNRRDPGLRQETRRTLRLRLRARRRRRFLGALLFAVALGVGAGAGPRLAGLATAAVYPEALQVRELAVLGARRLAPAEVAAAAALPPDARLDALDADALARRIEEHPWIVRARVAAFPPAGLVVSIQEREPAAILDRDGTAWFVDAEGVVFAALDETDRENADAPHPAHPRIVGAPEPADPALLAQAVRLAGAARAHGIPGLREVRIGSPPAGAPDRALPALLLAAPAAHVWLGGGEGDELDARLARLARLLRARLPEVAAASEIDLRFGERTVLRSDASRDAETRARGRAPASRNGSAG